MARHVAARARVAVVAPGPAQRLGLLEHRHGLDAGLPQPHGHRDAGRPGAEHRHPRGRSVARASRGGGRRDAGGTATGAWRSFRGCERRLTGRVPRRRPPGRTVDGCAPCPRPTPDPPTSAPPSRFLLRVLRLQAATVAGGVAFGVAVDGRAGVHPVRGGARGRRRAGDRRRRRRRGLRSDAWCAVVGGLGVVQALAGLGRHRFAVTMWLTAYMRTVQWLTAHTARLGASLAPQAAGGEVVERRGHRHRRGRPGAGHPGPRARLARRVRARRGPAAGRLADPRASSWWSGCRCSRSRSGRCCPRCTRRQAAQRQETGALTGLGADTVAGLRVLRGVGGEAAFLHRYARQSQRVRAAGVQVARTQATLDAAQVLLPGAVVVVVTWLGARFAVEGRITPGELVAFYGYAAFLLTPLRNLVELADKVTRAHVAARRLIAVLALRAAARRPRPTRPPPRRPGGAARPDQRAAGRARAAHRGGLRRHHGRRRAGRPAGPLPRRAGPARPSAGSALDALPLDEVRRRVLVADASPAVLSGTLRAALDPAGPAPRTGCCWPRSRPPRPPTCWRRSRTGWTRC